MKTLYIIGGTMGIGKTALCQYLKRTLPNSVFLDGDWCWDSSPFQVTEETKAMVMDNICHLLNNFLHCSAYENILFCWVLHQQAILDALLTRLDLSCCQVRCLSLTADADTLRQRLEWDIRAGIRNADILARSIPRLPLYQALDTEKIDTTGKTIEQIGEEILQGGVHE